MKILKKIAAACLLSVVLNACTDKATSDNQLTQKEEADGWKLLFNGTTTDGWHLYNVNTIGNTWLAEDGVLYCNPDLNLDHGDLVSDNEYANYNLVFDWKIPEDGNSGVFINVAERKDIATAWASGPEYQLLGDKHKDAGIPNKISGCLFNLSTQLHPAKLKPSPQWNHSEIVQKNGKITFYLNGVLTTEQDLTGDDWKNKIKNSNFKAFPEFGKYTSGRIVLQDWTKGVSFKNLKIREL